MTFENIQWTWMNGEFVPWAESNVPLSTHALHYGTGVFEGIRSYTVRGEPAIFRLDAHLDRLYRSAAVYGMRIPFSAEQLTEAQRKAHKAASEKYSAPMRSSLHYVVRPGEQTFDIVLK